MFSLLLVAVLNSDVYNIIMCNLPDMHMWLGLICGPYNRVEVFNAKWDMITY